MEEEDHKIPSETIDFPWIFTRNKHRKGKGIIKGKDSGKWLIFEHISKLDETWDKIKEATKAGSLGYGSKTATAMSSPNAERDDFKVICIYTSDFNDQEEVERVEKNIRALGVENKLIYKLDRDAGKSRRQGYSGTAKKISFSKKYFQIVEWLEKNPDSKYIKLIGTNKRGRKRYKFSRLDIDRIAYEKKVRDLTRLGFFVENKTMVEGEEVVFSC